MPAQHPDPKPLNEVHLREDAPFDLTPCRSLILRRDCFCHFELVPSFPRTCFATTWLMVRCDWLPAPSGSSREVTRSPQNFAYFCATHGIVNLLSAPASNFKGFPTPRLSTTFTLLRCPLSVATSSFLECVNLVKGFPHRKKPRRARQVQLFC